MDLSLWMIVQLKLFCFQAFRKFGVEKVAFVLLENPNVCCTNMDTTPNLCPSVSSNACALALADSSPTWSFMDMAPIY